MMFLYLPLCRQINITCIPLSLRYNESFPESSFTTKPDDLRQIWCLKIASVGTGSSILISYQPVISVTTEVYRTSSLSVHIYHGSCRICIIWAFGAVYWFCCNHKTLELFQYMTTDFRITLYVNTFLITLLTPNFLTKYAAKVSEEARCCNHRYTLSI